MAAPRLRSLPRNVTDPTRILACVEGAVQNFPLSDAGSVLLERATPIREFFSWPVDEALIAYEDAVLALVGEHDGHVGHRARTDGAGGRPLEIQLFEWASREAMDRYMADWRRTALSADREQAIARTEIVPVQLS